MKKFIKKIVAIFNENRAQIICGVLVMNGATNVYRTYASITE
jgi:hypothetical protein